MDGMKSRKVWVIDIATMKEINASGDILLVIVREEVRIVETRLMWIPGKRPVNVPTRMPASRNKNI